jgi:hypothetical protein
MLYSIACVQATLSKYLTEEYLHVAVLLCQILWYNVVRNCVLMELRVVLETNYFNMRVVVMVDEVNDIDPD